MIPVYIKSNILPPYPQQSPTGLASTINISKSYVWEILLPVPWENDKNIEDHCAIEDNDYCLHEHFPTPR